jgi:alpha galactosidase A-like protein/alpha galactosidase C-like protein
MRKAVLLTLLALAASFVVATPAVADPPPDSYNGLALTPPMGFNDWNAFGCNVSASLIEQTALAMHENGMQAAGYQYVNIDDCWMAGRDIPRTDPTRATAGRGADGHLIPDPVYFPPSAPGRTDGIKVVADYVHSLGLKLGIYEDTGTLTCQGLAGTYKGPDGATYDAVDAQDFADWGVDYLKDDWCNVPLGDVPGATRDDKAAYLYTRMSQALQATGRPIVFEAATLGDPGLSTYTWAPSISNLWRTTGDISASFSSMLRNFTANSTLAQYAGPGHWNDPDMLEVGTGSFSTLAAPADAGTTTVKVASTSRAIVGGVIRIGTAAAGDVEGRVVTAVGTAGPDGTGITLDAPLAKAHPAGEQVNKDGMTLTEEQTELTLWAEQAAPLIMGTDVVNMAPQDVGLYENSEVLAVDQDPLGVQAAVLTNADGHWVLVKPLANGNLAVVLFNANATPWADADVSLDALGLDSSQAYTARDPWTHTNDTVRGALRVASIPAHGSVLLRVSSAAQQLNDQLALVGDALGGSLHDQLQAAIDALADGRTADACGDLRAYVNHVQAQSGKQLAADRAAQLIADARQIEGLLGC